MDNQTLNLTRANFFRRIMARIFLKVGGWKAVGDIPDAPKFILVLAPHTSNWDLFIYIAVANAMGFKFSFFGKQELFRGPAAMFFRGLGGIPVNRHAPENLVDETAAKIRSERSKILLIAPEGTRSLTKYWKSGFYRIACQAEIPIALGFLDYKLKSGGLGPVIHPSGNIEEDMKIIRDFYSQINGRHPANIGKIAVRPSGSSR